MKWVCKSTFSTRAQMCLFDTVRTMCMYAFVNTQQIHTHNFIPWNLVVSGTAMFWKWWIFVGLRIAAKQSDVVVVESCGQYGIWVGSRLQLCTLQGKDRYPTWASLENHPLKHTLGGDMLVPMRVTLIECHCRVKSLVFFVLNHSSSCSCLLKEETTFLSCSLKPAATHIVFFGVHRSERWSPWLLYCSFLFEMPFKKELQDNYEVSPYQL